MQSGWTLTTREILIPLGTMAMVRERAAGVASFYDDMLTELKTSIDIDLQIPMKFLVPHAS